ncbi:MAG: hypothetical protein ACOYN0_07985 [Phycisphaerales bacterium]
MKLDLRTLLFNRSLAAGTAALFLSVSNAALASNPEEELPKLLLRFASESAVAESQPADQRAAIYTRWEAEFAAALSRAATSADRHTIRHNLLALDASLRPKDRRMSFRIASEALADECTKGDLVEWLCVRARLHEGEYLSTRREESATLAMADFDRVVTLAASLLETPEADSVRPLSLHVMDAATRQANILGKLGRPAEAARLELVGFGVAQRFLQDSSQATGWDPEQFLERAARWQLEARDTNGAFDTLRLVSTLAGKRFPSWHHVANLLSITHETTPEMLDVKAEFGLRWCTEMPWEAGTLDVLERASLALTMANSKDSKQLELALALVERGLASPKLLAETDSTRFESATEQMKKLIGPKSCTINLTQRRSELEGMLSSSTAVDGTPDAAAATLGVSVR